MKSMNRKRCPEKTGVYISGPELKETWRFMEDKQFGSLSWTVRILVREGLSSLRKSAQENAPIVAEE
jgi:hypothetical protein